MLRSESFRVRIPEGDLQDVVPDAQQILQSGKKRGLSGLRGTLMMR